MIAAVDDDVGKELAAARQLAPFLTGRQAVGADRGRRIAQLLAMGALLRHQLVGAAAVPERLVGIADRRLDRLRGGGGRNAGGRAHAHGPNGYCPRIIALAVLRVMPRPVTRQISASLTWRGPHSPRIWRTPSTTCSQPCI